MASPAQFRQALMLSRKHSITKRDRVFIELAGKKNWNQDKLRALSLELERQNKRKLFLRAKALNVKKDKGLNTDKEDLQNPLKSDSTVRWLKKRFDKKA